MLFLASEMRKYIYNVHLLRKKVRFKRDITSKFNAKLYELL